MDNKIEQIAEQNGMTVEFVTWFFNEKKSACGEHWFLALGAMWEGWKGRSAESTAALATIEKFREITNCPAGVGLQDHLRKLVAERDVLAAENVGLRNSSSHVLQRGEPPKTYRDEWFIARVKGHGFAVLRSLPEEYSYDYTTLDATYFRKDLILEWMQLPNSEFLPNIKTPATDAYLAGIKADEEKAVLNDLLRHLDKIDIENLSSQWELSSEVVAFVNSRLLREGADKC